MDKAEVEARFIANLLAILEARGIPEARLSVDAGLNRRFVTDLREGKVRSPKLSNAYMLAEVLDLDLRDIIAGRDRKAVNADLADLLASYTPEAQDQIVSAVRILLPPPDAES
jgi:transcriptional regulator with XRE-family HTH domain